MGWGISSSLDKPDTHVSSQSNIDQPEALKGRGEGRSRVDVIRRHLIASSHETDLGVIHGGLHWIIGVSSRQHHLLAAPTAVNISGSV